MREALGFLTVVGRAHTPSPAALRWFPAVGAGIGLALGGTWWVADEVWPPLVAATVVVALDAGLTGLLHLDGLADSADGLLPPLPPERRLEVMADPHAGAFAVVAVVVVIGLQVAALASVEVAVLEVTAIWAGSRGVVSAVPGRVPYLRPGGLAAAFAGHAQPLAVPVAWGLLLVVVAGIGGGPLGTAAVMAACAGAASVVWFGYRRLGGFTGDVLGAAIVVGQAVGLVVLAGGS